MTSYAAKFSFAAASADLPAIQVAVKRHNMRFVSNSAKWMFMERQGVVVSADDMGDFNAGCAAIRAILDGPKPAPLPAKSWWRRIFE